MTYEEIEEKLRANRRLSDIERLRRAVGEEAHSLLRKSVGEEHYESRVPIGQTDAGHFEDKARQFYADDINRWLDTGERPDPTSVLEHRERYVKSWAFAQILTQVDVEEEEDSDSDEDEHDAVLNLAVANAELGRACVTGIMKVQDLQDRLRTARAEGGAQVNVEFESLLDQVGAPKMNSFMTRELEQIERLEAYLEDMGPTVKRIVDDTEDKSKSVADLIELLHWVAQTVHQGYHVESNTTWQECRKGVCASIGDKLDELNHDPREGQ